MKILSVGLAKPYYTRSVLSISKTSLTHLFKLLRGTGYRLMLTRNALRVKEYYYLNPRKYAIVLVRPSRIGIFGSQPSVRFAKVISGFRRTGSSCGRG